MTLARRALVVAAALASSFAWAGPALAERTLPEGVRLSWVRSSEASSCIAPRALEEQVAERLGWNPFQGETRQWIEGVVVLDGDEYQVELFERDEAGSAVGSRVLRAPADDCRSLDEAATLAIALIIDPSATLKPRKSVPAPLPVPSSPKQSEPSEHRGSERSLVQDVNREVPERLAPPAEPTMKRTGAASRRCPALTTHELHGPVGSHGESKHGDFSATLTASPVAWAGVVPKTALGVETAGEVAWLPSGFALRLGMTHVPERWAKYASGELGYGLTLAQLGLCFSTLGPRLRGFGCATADAGALHTVVRQPDPLEPGDRFWSAGRAHAGIRLQLLEPLWIEARVFAGVPFRRLTFRVRVDGEPSDAYTQSWFLRGLGVGLGVHFE